MVVLEGMLHGLPVIAAEVGGPADILEHGRTGLLFPPRNVTALAAALRQLVENNEDRHRMGHAAAREVRHRWLWERLVPDMLDVYREFQPSSPRRRRHGDAPRKLTASRQRCHSQAIEARHAIRLRPERNLADIRKGAILNAEQGLSVEGDSEFLSAAFIPSVCHTSEATFADAPRISRRTPLTT